MCQNSKAGPLSKLVVPEDQGISMCNVNNADDHTFTMVSLTTPLLYNNHVIIGKSLIGILTCQSNQY